MLAINCDEALTLEMSVSEEEEGKSCYPFAYHSENLCYTKFSNFWFYGQNPKAVEQYFAVVLFVVQFYPVCNVGKFSNFGTVKRERVGVFAQMLGRLYLIYFPLLLFFGFTNHPQRLRQPMEPLDD